MSLDKKVIKDFVAAVNKKEETKTPTILTGTVHREGGTVSVKIDGSESLTPVSTVINVEDGERVTLTIENHKAMITGNLSSPAARTKEVEGLKEVVTDKVDTAQLKAIKAEVGEISGDVANFKETTTEKLTAQDAKIKKIDGDVANFKETTTEKLTAQDAKIKKIDGDVANFKETTTEKLTAQDAKIKKIDGDVANFKETTTEKLTAQDAKIKKIDGDVASFKETTTEKFKANEASIEDLKTGKLSAKDADLKYANIDFSNIGKTAMEYFYAQSGLIKDVTIGDATITGELVGVTISGDLIKGNTIVAEKLVIKGSDGLYYKLNTDGMTVEKEQTDYNSLNGQVIRAKSITATKIDVKDLVAFGATIGGFKIGQDSIYSGVKESVGNTTRGIYMDNDGQFVFGDASQYVKFYRVSEGKYKLAIAVEDLFIGSKSVAESIEDVKKTADNAASVASSASSAASTANSTANAAKSTAEGASKTASDAKSTADSASQVASNASSVAGTAKTTADNASKAASEANSTASTAKTTADQAKSTADTATKNLTALTAQVKEAETTIKKNKEEIELRAKKTEVTEAIDNIDIGGRNLAKNTATLPIGNGTWNTGTWRRSGTGSISNVDINDSPIPSITKGILVTRKDNTSQIGFCQDDFAGLRSGETYTVSAWVKCTENAKVKLETHWSNKDAVSGVGDPVAVEANKWTRITLTKSPTKDCLQSIAYIYLYIGSSNCEMYVCGIKLEKGNKATDWSPAPEDYYTKTETDASIQVLSDKISQQVSTTDKLGTRLSKVEQDSSSWSVTLETANAAKSAADNASQTASSAKSAADKANTAASHAQSTADTARKEASNAAKTATNYMKFDNSGLTVGDLTKNTLGRNVNIDNSSVNIRNGSNVLASFAESLIEIGKNTNTATISFLKGIVKLIGQKQTIEGTTFHDAHLLSTDMMTIGTGSTDPSSDKINALISLNGMSGEREVLASVTDTQGHSTLTVRDSSASLYSDGDAGYSSVNVITNKSTSQVEIHTNGSNGNRALINYSHAIQYYNNSTLLAAYNGKTPCLWDGFQYPMESTPVTLSAPISTQPHGVLLMFALWDDKNGSGTNNFCASYFIPKTCLNYWHYVPVFWQDMWRCGTKTIYVEDTQIKGHSHNYQQGTGGATNIKYTSSWFVLRRVYGI